jgi:hypothetical protein
VGAASSGPSVRPPPLFCLRLDGCPVVGVGSGSAIDVVVVVEQRCRSGSGTPRRVFAGPVVPANVINASLVVFGGGAASSTIIVIFLVVLAVVILGVVRGSCRQRGWTHVDDTDAVGALPS